MRYDVALLLVFFIARRFSDVLVNVEAIEMILMLSISCTFSLH
jgi:hypothetical protein